VARVGLVPDAGLEAEVRTLSALCAGQFVAGLGTGDHKSAPENLAYGVPFPEVAERRARLSRLVGQLKEEGIATWVGGGSTATNTIARSWGVPLNLWAAPPRVVASQASLGEVTWGGTLPRDPLAATALLASLARAGASWAVFAWPGSIAPVVAAAGAAGISLGPTPEDLSEVLRPRGGIR